MENKKYRKGVMGFDQMAVGLGVLAIVVAMILVVLYAHLSVKCV